MFSIFFFPLVLMLESGFGDDLDVIGIVLKCYSGWRKVNSLIDHSDHFYMILYTIW